MAIKRSHRDVTPRENPYGQIPDEEEADDDLDREPDDGDYDEYDEYEEDDDNE